MHLCLVMNNKIYKKIKLDNHTIIVNLINKQFLWNAG